MSYVHLYLLLTTPQFTNELWLTSTEKKGQHTYSKYLPNKLPLLLRKYRPRTNIGPQRVVK
jgi:hypothetical protein